MQRRFKAASLVVVLAAFSLTLVGCGQLNKIKGEKAFKEANVLYSQQDYKHAAAKYEEVVGLDPDLSAAYFFLGNSYDNQYKASRKGEAQNDAYLTKAIDAYKKGAATETDKLLKTRCLQFLVAAYGPDRLNDPAQAEPLLLEMIKVDPSEIGNYVTLSKMYEDSGQYELAEETLLKAKAAMPKDSNMFMQLASYYNRQGDFEKTMEALNERAAADAKNPEAYYTISMFYWEKAYRDFRLKDAERLNLIALGVDAADKALQLKPDYFDAVKAKELLRRAEALHTKDAGRQAALLSEAKTLSDQYNDLKAQKAGQAAKAEAKGAKKK